MTPPGFTSWASIQGMNLFVEGTTTCTYHPFLVSVLCLSVSQLSKCPNLGSTNYRQNKQIHGSDTSIPHVPSPVLYRFNQLQ
jgi:hypothetical protein